MVFVMLIGAPILILVDPSLLTAFISAIVWSLGVQRNNQLFLDPMLKLNIEQWLLVVVKSLR